MTQNNNISMSEKKQLSILGVEFYYLALMGIFFAFLGFVAENAAKAIAEGVIDARFHRLPFISPYGLIPIAFHLLLGSPQKIAFFGKPILTNLPEKKRRIVSELVAYLSICLAVFLGELAIGNLWDVAFGVSLWDYSNMPLHITQYTSVLATFGYGTGAYLLFRFVFSPLLSFLRTHIPYRAAKWIVLTLGVLIVLDTCFLMCEIMLCGEASMLWAITF